MSGIDMLRQWNETINRHDAAAFADFYAEDAVVLDPQYPDPLRGRDAVLADIEAYFRAFPDIQQVVHSAIESGDTVAFEVTFRGTHQGPIETDDGEIPPTGMSMEIRGAGFNRMDAAGRIAEQRRYYDMAGMLAQLGLA